MTDRIDDINLLSKWGLADEIINLEPSPIREMVKTIARPGVISFAGGLPAPELFPVMELQNSARDALEKYGAKIFQYSLTRGIIPLREILANRATERCTETSIDNILVTSGAQQGLEFIARAFIKPNDHIIVERPTYVGALQIFNYYQAKYAEVEMDDNGMIIDKLVEQIEKHKPRFIYTISNYQNPTGISISLERRHQLIEVAQKYNLPVIDDNPYGDLYFSGERLKTLKSIGGEIVIALRTFSKILTPGLRIGWINAFDALLNQLEKVKQFSDLHTNTFCQYLIYEYISQGKLQAHINKIQTDYKAKRDKMLSELKANFPEPVTWTIPEGGMFIWIKLPEGISANKLLETALKQNVAFIPGSFFYPKGDIENCFRLNFSNASPDNIAEGIKRLGAVISAELK